MTFYLHSRYSIFCGAALLTGLVSACKKEVSAPAADANTSALVTHPWRIVAFADTDISAKPPKTTNVFVSFPAYRLDDTYQFKLDNSLVFDEGRLKAKSTDAQTTDGSWQFQTDQTRLTITLAKAVALGTTGSTNSSTYSILKLTADTLRITNGSVSQTIVVTLAR